MKKRLSLLFFVALISAFFPLPYHLYVQLALVVIMGGLILFGVKNREIEWKEIFTPYMALMGIWLFWSVLSLLWVQNQRAWLIGNGILFIAFSHSMVLTYLYKEKSFRLRLKWAVLIILVLHHMFGWFEWLVHLANSRAFLSNPMLFFPNINDFALLMLFGLIFVLNWKPEGELLFMDKILIPFFKGLFVLSSLFLIYAAHSRVILVVALAAVVFYGILQISDKEKRRKVWLALLAVVALGLVIFGADIGRAILEDYSFVVRFNLIRNGWEHLKQTSFLGVGTGNIPGYMETYPYYWISHHTVMHNWWMGVLVTYGLLFFIIYMAYHLFVFVQSYIWGTQYQKKEGKFIATWLIAFSIAAMIPNTLFSYIWFWFIHHLTFVTFEQTRMELKTT